MSAEAFWAYLFEALCATLFTTTVCRLAKLNKAALLRARLAYYLLGIGVVVCFYAATFLGYTPSWPDCIMIGSYTFVQLVTSRSWRTGFPHALATEPGALQETNPQSEIDFTISR